MTDIVGGLLVREHQVLMAHRSPSRRNYPDSWSFPGGHVEKGETLEQALTRELFEEIGVRARSWSFMQCFDDQSAGSDRVVTFHFFMVDKWDGNPMNISGEHTEIRWVNLVDAPKMQGLTLAFYAKLFAALSAAS